MNIFHFGFNKHLYVCRPQGAEAVEDAWWQLRQLIAGKVKFPGGRRVTLSGSHSSLSHHLNVCPSRYIYMNKKTRCVFVFVCVCERKYILCVRIETYTDLDPEKTDT